MKVAVIGAGNWGKNLVSNLHALGALAAVAEPNPALRQAVAERFPDVAVFDDFAPVLASDVTGVAIATPVFTHHAVARAALEAGKDVFVEKPMTMSTAEAEELVALASANDRVLMVGHLLLFQPAIETIKSALADGVVGRVLSLHQERLNLGKARSVENALWSLGVHDVAVLLDLVGEVPSRVQVSGHRGLQAAIEDDVYLHLDFPGGAQAHLHCSWLWPERRRRLTVVGTAAMLVYDELAQTVTLQRKSIDASLQNQDGGIEVLFEGSSEPLRLELQHFLDRVQDRQRPRSDGTSGIEVVRVLEQATRILEAK